MALLNFRDWKRRNKKTPKATKKPLQPNRCLSPTFFKMSRKWYLDPSYQHSMPQKPSPSNKDKKANVKRQLWISLAASRSGLVLQAFSTSFLSHPIQASSKATPRTLCIFCTKCNRHFSMGGMDPAGMFHFPPTTSQNSIFTQIIWACPMDNMENNHLYKRECFAT